MCIVFFDYSNNIVYRYLQYFSLSCVLYSLIIAMKASMFNVNNIPNYSNINEIINDISDGMFVQLHSLTKQELNNIIVEVINDNINGSSIINSNDHRMYVKDINNNKQYSIKLCNIMKIPLPSQDNLTIYKEKLLKNRKKYQDAIMNGKRFGLDLINIMIQELEDLKNYYPYSGFIEAALGEMDIRLRDIKGPSSGITDELIYRRHLRGAANIDITSGNFIIIITTTFIIIIIIIIIIIRS